MNHLVISGAVVEAMKAKYGSEMVDKCFYLASQKLPKYVYEDIKDSGDEGLIDCFCTIYGGLLNLR
jgi:hypothetical protein